MSAIYKHEVWHWFLIFTLNSLYSSVGLNICVCCLSLWYVHISAGASAEVRGVGIPLDLGLQVVVSHVTLGAELRSSARAAEPSPHTLLLKFDYDN